MSELQEKRVPLQQIILEAERTLDNLDPAPFSPVGYSRLKEKISEYIAQLIVESAKVCKRYQSDMISAAHVERASEYLVSSTTRRIFKHLGTAGGLLLGASVSNFLAIATTEQFSMRGMLISAGLGIVGAFLVALHMAKD